MLYTMNMIHIVLQFAFLLKNTLWQVLGEKVKIKSLANPEIPLHKYRKERKNSFIIE